MSASQPRTPVAQVASRVRRLLRHLWADSSSLRPHLDAAALAELTEQVSRSEAQHSGEIRLCIEASLPAAEAWRGTSPRQRAIDTFSQLRVWDTEHNNGVLIYLLLAERHIEIVADRGLDRLVGAMQWQQLADELALAMHGGAAQAGLTRAIQAVTELLRRHFPLAAGQSHRNELPDTPVLR